MSSLQEKIATLQAELDESLNKMQVINKEIEAKQAEKQQLIQPIIEAQGALKALKELNEVPSD
jgi:chromosome segregation ATPase|tara:strand:- start:173 stop:361 length:189 start_codon:yes stop_codon:yes gene_type:complete